MPVSEFDRNLLHRCLNHEEGSWPDFVDRFLGLIYHVIRMTAQNRSMPLAESDVESIAAEILQDLVKNEYALLRQFREESSLTAYLTVITRRICVRKLLRLRRESALGHVHASRSSIDGSSAEIEPVLALDEVDKLLGLLDEPDSTVVRLYHVEFLGYRDIARRLGIDEESIGSILSQARKKLHAVTESSG